MISRKVQGQKKRIGTTEAWPFWFKLLIVSVATLPVLSDYHTTRLLHHHMMREKGTLLHFFFHDTFTGNNPNSVMVAHANLTMNHHFQSLLPFGSIYVLGALLTEGPDLTSNVVGHAQGFYVSAGKELLMVVNCIDYGFTDGEFSGSSISMFSRNPVTETEREVAVVGGRGKFRMARGFARLKTLFFNVTSALVEYQVTGALLRTFKLNLWDFDVKF